MFGFVDERPKSYQSKNGANDLGINETDKRRKNVFSVLTVEVNTIKIIHIHVSKGSHDFALFE